MNVKTAPTSSPGTQRGNVTSTKARNGVAPRSVAASSHESCTLSMLV
jgi:hypothetical protein